MAKRAFSPIFNVNITPTAIDIRTDKHNAPYAVLEGATVAREGREPSTRMVMVFGKSYAAVADKLAVGTTVELAVQHDGGVMKVIGEPKIKQAA